MQKHRPTHLCKSAWRSHPRVFSRYRLDTGTSDYLNYPKLEELVRQEIRRFHHAFEIIFVRSIQHLSCQQSQTMQSNRSPSISTPKSLRTNTKQDSPYLHNTTHTLHYPTSQTTLIPHSSLRPQFYTQPTHLFPPAAPPQHLRCSRRPIFALPADTKSHQKSPSH